MQPTCASRRPNDQGLLPQPATQIGSHFTSNSTFGCFFVPGSQTQIGTSPQVAPQCMQAGFSSFFDASFLSAVLSLSAVFSLPSAPQASRATASSRQVMVRPGIV